MWVPSRAPQEIPKGTPTHTQFHNEALITFPVSLTTLEAPWGWGPGLVPLLFLAFNTAPGTPQGPHRCLCRGQRRVPGTVRAHHHVSRGPRPPRVGKSIAQEQARSKIVVTKRGQGTHFLTCLLLTRRHAKYSMNDISCRLQTTHKASTIILIILLQRREWTLRRWSTSSGRATQPGLKPHAVGLLRGPFPSQAP